MKISELIKEFQHLKDTEGDLEVMWHSEAGSDDLKRLEDIVTVETYSDEKWIEISTNYLLMTLDGLNEIL